MMQTAKLQKENLSNKYAMMQCQAVNVKGGMALRNGMRNDCGMARRIKFRDIFFVLVLLQLSGRWTVCLPTNSCSRACLHDGRIRQW